MEFIKSGWKTVVGGQASSVMDGQPDVAETVERLVERVETSTLLEDRRDACRALKSLSKTYRLEVGAKAMDALLFVIQNDSNDNEIVAFALETLNNIIGIDEDVNAESGTDLSIQFTEIFIKRKENVQLIIDLLAEFDFKIRWPTIKLLYGLLRNKLRECQDCILTHPMGISRMMDLLLDPREVIRNDALLVLIYLTKNNTNIQKIVAFENAFDRILDIITSEGCSDGGIIVEDCLLILLNLLKTNTSNQNFFQEGSYINRLLPFLDFSFDTSWNPQKINNLLLMFKVIRSLVSPKNPAQVTSACQKVMNQKEVLQKLCAILMSNGIPAEILTETINCVAEVIRGNQVNQDYFSRVNAPIDPPKPVIVILLMSMVNEKQPFELRCAVLYCFQCFLYKNDLGQAQIVETLLPSSSEVPMVSAGQLLCSGFFSNDSLSNWFVAVALSYTLLGNVTQKEQLLRVQLATDHSNAPTSLLAYCSNLLQKGGHYQRKISLLMLLSTWLANSPIAVSSFLSISTNIPYLTSQIGLVEDDETELIVQGLCAFLLGICIFFNDNSVPSFTRDDLSKIITSRIGKEIFVDKLSLISKNEKFSLALQKPQISYLKASDVLFDYEFCNLFRNLEGSILKTIQPPSNDGNPESNLSNEDHKLLIKYKELIRQQDEQLTSLKKQLTELRGQNEYLTHQLNDQHSIIQQLRDQVSLLKTVQKSVYEPSTAIPTIPSTSPPMQQISKDGAVNPNIPNEDSTFLSLNDNVPPENVPQATIDNQQQSYTQNYNAAVAGNMAYNLYDPNTYNANIDQMVNQIGSLQVDDSHDSGVSVKTEATPTVNNQIDYLINENRRLLLIIDQYKYWEQNCYAYYNANSPGDNNNPPKPHASTTLSEQNLSTQVNVSDSDISRNISEPDQPLSNAKPSSESLVEKLKNELESIRKEQEDLLALIGDQNLKIQFYEKEFKSRGFDANNSPVTGVSGDIGENQYTIAQPTTMSSDSCISLFNETNITTTSSGANILPTASLLAQNNDLFISSQNPQQPAAVISPVIGSIQQQQVKTDLSFSYDHYSYPQQQQQQYNIQQNTFYSIAKDGDKPMTATTNSTNDNNIP